MNSLDILAAVAAGESQDWEFKSAKGGLPGSLWDTYSAMANTDGGGVVLGVKELDNSQFEVQGLDDPIKIEKDFWNTINNRGKVSANLHHQDRLTINGFQPDIAVREQIGTDLSPIVDRVPEVLLDFDGVIQPLNFKLAVVEFLDPQHDAAAIGIGHRTVGFPH